MSKSVDLAVNCQVNNAKAEITVQQPMLLKNLHKDQRDSY